MLLLKPRGGEKASTWKDKHKKYDLIHESFVHLIILSIYSSIYINIGALPLLITVFYQNIIKNKNSKYLLILSLTSKVMPIVI